MKTSAAAKRDQIKQMLLKAAAERALVLSPDIWSDVYRQQSYLGCTAHWIDNSWILHSFEIFCMPFNTPDKKAPSVRKVRDANVKSILTNKCSCLIIVDVTGRFIRLQSRSVSEKHYLGE